MMHSSDNQPRTTSDEAEATHRRAIIVDGHCDTPYRLFRHELHLEDGDPEAQADLSSLKAGGITASFFAAYVPPFYAGRGAADFARRLIRIIREEAGRHPDTLVHCTDSAGIRAAKREGRVALMIGVEGGHAIEDSMEILRELYASGVRYMTLTHVNTNNWCDSSGDVARHAGLTAFGRDVVRAMNDLGMIVDVSHISDDAFRHVLETTRVPVIASHSSCRAICRHPRNLTDDMLRALAANGGVCMINFFSLFISDEVAVRLESASKERANVPKPSEVEELPDDRADWSSYLAWFQSLDIPPATLDQVADHIFHAADVAGIDHVGIGSDFDGVPSLPIGLTSAAMLPSLTARLLERGMREDEAEKVLGGNFMRVFEAAEAARAR